MKAEVHIAPLFSNHRMELIDYCLQLQRQGMGFLYILPSRDSIFSVRNHILQTNKGMVQSAVIMFDDLERMITRDDIDTHRVLKPWASRILLKEAVEQAGNLKCYGDVRSKEGFIDDVASVIKSIKRRTCLGPDEFLKSIQALKDKPSLFDKVHALYLIYKTYQDELCRLGLYDEDDIALEAVKKAGTSTALHNIGAIIIDGFINVDRVDMAIIKSLKDKGNMDIICNIPFSTPFIDAFLAENIVKDFKEAGFKIIDIKTGYGHGTKAQGQLTGAKADCAREMDTRSELNHINCAIRDLAFNMFTGQWPVIQDHGCIKISDYPSIESEVRQTARLIKKRLMEGEKAEDIAVYANNLREYYPYIVGIFREFNIPVALAQTMALGSAPLVVDIMEYLEKNLDDRGTFESFLVSTHRAIKGAVGKDDMLEPGDLKDDHGWQLFLRKVRAYNGLLNVLKDLGLACGALDMHKVESDKGAFLQHIKDIVDRTEIIIETSPRRGVAVLNTDRARGIYFNWVFILGANEGSIPKSHMNSGMFSAAEYNMLWDDGITLYKNRWELDREKIRFVLALASARKGVNISYTTSSEDGEYAIHSPFVDEVAAMVSSMASSLDGPKVTLRDTMVVPLKEVMSPRELSVQTMLACWQGPWQTGVLDQCIIDRLRKRMGPLARLLDFPLKAGGVEFSRYWSEAFDRYDGIIGSDYLPQKSGQYYFTASQVNTYFKCPFRYMMEYVFKIGTYEEDEDQYTNMDLGNIYHHILKACYRDIRDFDTLDENLLEGCLNKCIDEEFSKLRDINQSKIVLQAIRQEVTDTVKDFILHDFKRLKHYKDATGGKKELRPYLMEYEIVDDDFHSGMAFKSRIDRIDLEYCVDTEQPTGKFIIYDYKKKNVHGLDDLLKSRDSQLPIYYNSLVDNLVDNLKEELGSSKVECMGLMYLGVEQSGSGHKVDGVIRQEYAYELNMVNKHYLLIKEEFDVVMDFCREMVIKAVGNILQGRFHPPRMCTNKDEYSMFKCPWEGVCRYHGARMAKKRI